jgi:hypothetical protein
LLHCAMSPYGTTRTSRDVRLESETRSKADIAQAPVTYRDLRVQTALRNHNRVRMSRAHRLPDRGVTPRSAGGGPSQPNQAGLKGSREGLRFAQLRPFQTADLVQCRERRSRIVHVARILAADDLHVKNRSGARPRRGLCNGAGLPNIRVLVQLAKALSADMLGYCSLACLERAATSSCSLTPWAWPSSATTVQKASGCRFMISLASIVDSFSVFAAALFRRVSNA